MAIVYSDNFNVSTTVALTAHPGWAFVSGTDNATVNAPAGRVLSSAAAGQGVYRLTNAALPTGDQTVQILFRNFANFSEGGPVVRMAAAADTGYYMRAQPSSGLTLLRRVAGVNTPLATTSGGITNTADHVIALEVSGTTTVVLRRYLAGVEVGTAFSDTSASRIQSGGAIGLITRSDFSTNQWDDLEVDDPNAGGGATDVSFAGTAPLPVLAATVGHAPPVFAVSFAGTGPLQAFAATVAHDALPDAPTGLGYTIVAGTPLLAWTPGALRVTGQRLERRLAGG
jgi:hypothetical protein